MNPLVLIILDGFGVPPPDSKREGNAIALAKTPNLDRLLKVYPHTTLEASGEAVGLPPGVMGNSEVGHLTIGSGRIIYQDLSRINHAIADGSFFKNPVLRKACQTAVANKKKLHLIGLLSDGGVHSHLKHLFALVEMANRMHVPRVAIHAFLDGRDTPPKSSQKYLQDLQKELGERGEIATLIGRYYAMDRDKRWERIRIATEALVEGKGETHEDPIQAVKEAYEKHITDEFIQPIIFPSKKQGNNRIEKDDVVIFFNFRADRARELTQTLALEGLHPGMFVCLTQYDKAFDLPVAFPPERPTKILAEILSERGILQFHTAETEKYAHVTYFLNGGVEKPFPGEERLLVPSPKDVPTYDRRPEMSAREVTAAALQKIREGKFPVIIMNYANPDMVGHSGMLGPTIRAVEVIDECIGTICEEVLKRKGTVLITADHGNCEQMLDDQGGPHTAHTTNPVPFLLVSDTWQHINLCSHCGLKDVAPTVLNVLGIPQPAEMTGESLIIES